MIKHEAKWLLAGLLWLAVLSACAPQDAERAATDTETSVAAWEEHMRAAGTAYQRGRYAEAERQLDAALRVAESFGSQDPRYAVSLNNLAELYRTQGRYAEAEPTFSAFKKNVLVARNMLRSGFSINCPMSGRV